MALILAVIYLALSVTGASQKSKPAITWKLLTNPVRFGGSLILNCKTSYKEKCSSEIHRQWTKGNDNDLIFNNGVFGKDFGNSSKYSEQTSDSCRHSSLIVTDVNERDFNIQYTCSFGYPGEKNTSIWVSKTDLLSLNNTEYEYYPEQNMLESWEIRKGGRSKFFAHIKKIYPVPSCVIYIQGQYQPSLKIITDRNGLFFSVDMFTDYLIGEYLPTEDWCIHCSFKDMDFSIMNNGSKSLVCGVAKEDPLVIINFILCVLYSAFPLIDILNDVCFRLLKWDNAQVKTLLKRTRTILVRLFIAHLGALEIALIIQLYSDHLKQGIQTITTFEQTIETVSLIHGMSYIVYFMYKNMYLLWISKRESLNLLIHACNMFLFFGTTGYVNYLISDTKELKCRHVPFILHFHVSNGTLTILGYAIYFEVYLFEKYSTGENSAKASFDSAQSKSGSENGSYTSKDPLIASNVLFLY